MKQIIVFLSLVMLSLLNNNCASAIGDGSQQHSTAVMLLSYDPNHVIGKKEKDVAQEVMFSSSSYSVSKVFQEVSYGQVVFQGDVFGPFVIAKPPGCDAFGDADHADAKAQAAGVQVGKYKHKVYVYADRATSDYVREKCNRVGSTVYGGPVSLSFIGYFDAGLGLYAHELGHALGMHHAESETSPNFDCELGRAVTSLDTGLTIFDDFEVRGTCKLQGDGSDLLGHGPGLNAPHKVQMGWAEPSKVNQSGVYPLSLPLVFSKKNTGDDYYVSYRGDQGVDAGLIQKFKNRVSIHRYKSGSLSQSVLLGSIGGGESFSDPSNGVSISGFFLDGSGVPHVRVSLPGGDECMHNKPSIGINPGYQYVKKGDSAVVQVILKNQDSAKCQPSVFKLSSEVPQGDSASYEQDSVSLKAGETKFINLFVKTSSDSQLGQHLVWVRVKQDGVPEHTSFSSAVVHVEE